MENKKGGFLGVIPVIAIVILIILGKKGYFNFDDPEELIVKVIPIMFGVFFFTIILAFIVKNAKAQKHNDSKEEKYDSHTDNTQYNHDRTFHRSEFDRLGIDMKEFAIDKNQYKKDAPSNKSKSSKSTTKIVEEEPVVIEEHEDILKKVISELGESEFSNWRETYEARQHSTYDVKGDN